MTIWQVRKKGATRGKRATERRSGSPRQQAAKPTRSARRNFARSARSASCRTASCASQATFNNTIVTLDRSRWPRRQLVFRRLGRIQGLAQGHAVCRAAGLAARPRVSARDQYGMKTVEVRVKGPGRGRESAVRALASSGLHINAIKDVTPCRTTAAVRRSAAAFDGFTDSLILVSRSVLRRLEGEKNLARHRKQFAGCAAGKGRNSS